MPEDARGICEVYNPRGRRALAGVEPYCVTVKSRVPTPGYVEQMLNLNPQSSLPPASACQPVSGSARRPCVVQRVEGNAIRGLRVGVRSLPQASGAVFELVATITGSGNRRTVLSVTRARNQVRTVRRECDVRMVEMPGNATGACADARNGEER